MRPNTWNSPITIENPETGVRRTVRYLLENPWMLQARR